MTNEVKLDVKAKAPRKRKIASLDKRKARAGWLFILPFIIGFVLVYLPIVFDSFWMAFNELTLLPNGGYELEFVGFKNFIYAFTEDVSFTQQLTTGITNLILEVPAILLFSLFMAVLMNQKMAGRAVFRAIFFLPVVLSTGIMETIAMNSAGFDSSISGGIDDGSGGSASEGIVSALDIEALFANMKFAPELVTNVVTLINNIYDIVNRSGVQMLIFLAGLQSISPSIYEACRIDGATGWETFWKVTFPMISPMILVNAVYTIIDAFTRQANPVMSYLDSVMQGSNGDVRSTAMAWIYFIIVMVILAAVAGLLSMFVFYQRKD